MELTRGKRRGSKIIRKARIRVAHRSTCPQWIAKVRLHGGHPDTHELIHDSADYVLSEWAA
jgi:hypothetical protein